jgi:hypothetical protein
MMRLQDVTKRLVRFALVLVMGGLCQAVLSCNDGSLVIDWPGTIVIGGGGHDCDDCDSGWWFWGGCDDDDCD